MGPTNPIIILKCRIMRKGPKNDVYQIYLINSITLTLTLNTSSAVLSLINSLFKSTIKYVSPTYGTHKSNDDFEKWED